MCACAHANTANDAVLPCSAARSLLREILCAAAAVPRARVSRRLAMLDCCVAIGASLHPGRRCRWVNMQGLVVGDLRIEALDDDPSSAVRLLWRGKSNNRHPGEALAPFFREVLATAGRRQLPLELHFEDLEHFNSSTITSIIQLIQDARARGI